MFADEKEQFSLTYCWSFRCLSFSSRVVSSYDKLFSTILYQSTWDNRPFASTAAAVRTRNRLLQICFSLFIWTKLNLHDGRYVLESIGNKLNLDGLVQMSNIKWIFIAVVKQHVKIAKKKESDYQSFGNLWCFGFWSASLTCPLHPKNLSIFRNISFLYHFIISIICARNLIQTLRRYLFRTVPVNDFWHFASIWGVFQSEIGINAQKTHTVHGIYLVHWNYGKYQRSTIPERIPVIYTVFIPTLLSHHISSAFYRTTLHRLHYQIDPKHSSKRVDRIELSIVWPCSHIGYPSTFLSPSIFQCALYGDFRWIVVNKWNVIESAIYFERVIC